MAGIGTLRCKRERLAASAAPTRSSVPAGRGRHPSHGVLEQESPASRGFPWSILPVADQTTSGSLNASGSSSGEPTGMQLQNTFLSPCTLSTRATGGQYFCRRRLASGNAASSRG